MRVRITLILVCLVLVTNYSCKEKVGKNINQGEIHYNIEYSGNVSSLSLKPKNLIVSFKDDKILFDIKVPIADAGISNLSNPEIGVYEIYVNLFNRYSYTCIPGEIPPGFSSMNGMSIKKTSKTTNICGFKCNNAEVTFNGDRDRIYSIWYTNDIKVKNPNLVNPFSEIDGVLMSFFYFLGDTELHFEAFNVYRKEIPDILFEKKRKYKPVSREHMDELILDMINY